MLRGQNKERWWDFKNRTLFCVHYSIRIYLTSINYLIDIRYKKWDLLKVLTYERIQMILYYVVFILPHSSVARCACYHGFILYSSYKQTNISSFHCILYTLSLTTSVNINICITKTKENNKNCMFLYNIIVIIFN